MSVMVGGVSRVSVGGGGGSPPPPPPLPPEEGVDVVKVASDEVLVLPAWSYTIIW